MSSISLQPEKSLHEIDVIRIIEKKFKVNLNKDTEIRSQRGIEYGVFNEKIKKVSLTYEDGSFRIMQILIVFDIEWDGHPTRPPMLPENSERPMNPLLRIFH